MPRFLDAIMKPLGPKPPYTDPTGDKGWFTPLAHPQAEVWTETALTPPGWEAIPPLTVALLTDFHAGSHTGDLDRFRRLADAVNARAPDLVLFGGDYVNTQAWGKGLIPPHVTADILARFDAPLGRFAVIGNHDWSYGFAAVAEALAAAGVETLENANRPLPWAGHGIAVAGVSDEKDGAPDMAAALAGLADRPTIVLAHDPYSFHRMPRGPYVMLSGHTHGGQFCLPGGRALVNASLAPLRWTKGVVAEDGKLLYVSRGLGTSFLPIRTWCPPEVSMLRIGGGSQG